jgi:hypothetical protein
MQQQKLLLSLVALSSAMVAQSVPALADAISPRVTGGGHTYSKEAPNTSFYGTGISGRLAEASALRFEGERLTQDGNFEQACKILFKAVQLDQGDPAGHYLLAKALSAKATTSKPDLKTYYQAINEWKLLWHHDADPLEQIEAKQQTHRLSRLAKRIEKQLKRGVSPESMVAAKEKVDKDDLF